MKTNKTLRRFMGWMCQPDTRGSLIALSAYVVATLAMIYPVLQPVDILTTTLTWEAAVELNGRHVVFVHLLSSDDKLVAQHDDVPIGNTLPRGAWPPGATFECPVSVQLPDELSEGEYRLLVGVYSGQASSVLNCLAMLRMVSNSEW